MKKAKKLITDGFGTITINGNCSKGAKFKVYINDKIVYASNLVQPEPITSGTLGYSGQMELATFDIKLNDIVHYDKYKIVCTKGSIQIGALHEHFHKDIVSTATPTEVFHIYRSRIYHRSQLLNKDEPQYSFYYKEENDMLDNKIHVELNDEKIEHDVDEGHLAGWVYNLNENDNLKFWIDYLTPNDEMAFIVNALPGEEYFLKDYK